MWNCSLHVYIIVPCGKSIWTVSIKKADIRDVKNGNQKFDFSLFECSDSTNSRSLNKGIQIYCV